MLRVPDPRDVAANRTIARWAGLLVIDSEIRVIRQKIESVAERLNHCAGEVLRIGRAEIVKGLIHRRKRTILARQGRKVNCRWFCGARLPRVDADNRILRRQFLVGHLNRTVAVQCCLKEIHGRHPRKIEQAAEGLREIPCDNHSVGKLHHIAGTREPRFKEDADRRSLIVERACGLRQFIESAEDDATVAMPVGIEPNGLLRSAESDRPYPSDQKRVPRLPGKGECELLQADLRAREFNAVVGIPFQSHILDPVSCTLGYKSKRTAREVEEIGCSQRAIVQLHYDKVAIHPYLTDGMTLLIFLLRPRQTCN